jgi:sulfur-oxidizing protein SoxX
MMKTIMQLLAFILFSTAVYADEAYNVLLDSMKDKNFVTVERLEQDELQEFCSQPRSASVDEARAAKLREAALKGVLVPKDERYLGDWQLGEKVASNGRGLQYSDDPEQENGGNCYACHQLDPKEVAYGNLGPSLSGYGARGQSAAMLQYTWTKLWNTHAYNVCSHMPRFGAAGILTEKQLQDVMAFLFDPNSPVNRSQP